jgi:metastasis-associated protein MTA
LKDGFFYHLTYDPYQKSLINDKGEIRVGFRFQTEIPPLKITPSGELLPEEPLTELAALEKQANDRVLRSRVSMSGSSAANANQPEIPIALQAEDALFQWCPLGATGNNYTNELTDEQIDKFLVLAKSVGTFARALDCNNAFKQPSLPLSAAAASRDITLVILFFQFLFYKKLN